MELMNEAVRWRLNQNDCQNRGYVLDGYPKSYKQAQGVFYIFPDPPKKAEKKEGEEEEEPAEEEVDEEEAENRKKPKF